MSVVNIPKSEVQPKPAEPELLPPESPERALVKAEPQALALRSDPESILRYAIDKGADVSVIERIMVVRDKLRAEQAKEAFDAAMRGFQSECPPVIKNRNVEGAYNYAEFDLIVEVTKPCREKCGFSFALGTDVESQPGWVIASCMVKHVAGHAETTKVKLPIGSKTRLMSDTQVYAGAISFASRRAFCNAFGIVPQGEDTDGRMKAAPAKGPSSIAAEPTVRELGIELWKTLGDTCKGEKDWSKANQWLIDECILTPEEAAPNLSKKRFAEVIAKAKAKKGIA